MHCSIGAAMAKFSLAQEECFALSLNSHLSEDKTDESLELALLDET
jgi:hypothetical protein